PGMLTTLLEFLRDNPNPTEQEVRIAISGNLCRCTGYQGIVNAALDAAKRLQAPAAPLLPPAPQPAQTPPAPLPAHGRHPLPVRTALARFARAAVAEFQVARHADAHLAERAAVAVDRDGGGRQPRIRLDERVDDRARRHREGLLRALELRRDVHQRAR